MDKYYLAALTGIDGLGSVHIRKLMRYFGTARAIWQAGMADIVCSKCFDDKTAARFISQRGCIDVDNLAADWSANAIRLYSLYDGDYPNLLRETYNPPVVLFVRGQLPTDEVPEPIAIVGTRRATAYGRNTAGLLSEGLAASGMWIVSGAARGIDTAAHKGAMRAGRTIAVLGCGVDVAYPPENAKLLAAIAANGAIVSEYMPGTYPHQGFFPARNRIISGLSRGVIVVEAAERSGSLITADFALEEGRDVFAVPGSIFSNYSHGTHSLIRQGAKLTETVGDVLEEYGLESAAVEKNGAALLLKPDEQKVYACLSPDLPCGVEELVEKTMLPPAAVTYILLQFQLGGIIVEQPGKQYVRAVREGL